MKNSVFFKQAELMLRTISHISLEKCFALKGGTAINLFLRDLPRLSVDVDLTYIPIEQREKSLSEINLALDRICKSIAKAMPRAKIQLSYSSNKEISKIFIREEEVQIKIEPNFVIRGTVFPCVESSLSKKAEDLFGLSVSTPTLSLADLYGGKICAALDRQHPRDLFDIHILLKNEGITKGIRKTFLVYLISHARPMNELIDPPRKDLRRIFESEFAGMTSEPVLYEELLSAREELIAVLQKDLTTAERRFLLSIKEINPQWELLGIDGIEKLPAVQWKLANLKKMNKKKHGETFIALKRKLNL